ncbi:MAG: BatD family protein, partial [Longimicrobiales bacterium]|nr:BatD family protein [Longimicrobiales bacterium]
MSVLFAVGYLAVATPAAGQGVAARAYVTPGNTVGVGGSFVVNVEVSGTQSMNRDVAPPDLGGFARFLGTNTQSSVQMVNGRTTVSVTVQHRYQALVEGSHTIPAIDVIAEGRELSTDPIELTVSVEAAESDPASGIGPDELFITAEASRTSVLEGEPFVVEYRIWTRVDVTNFGMTDVPESAGFWVEDISPQGPPQVEERVRNGEQYATAVVRRVALVPTGPGERTIEPIGIEASVRVQADRDPFERVFGRPSIFGTTTVPVTVLSNPLTITVTSLPAGQPDEFTGIVGSLGVTSEVDRDSVDANEAVTLTVRVSGDGHLRSLTTPDLGLPDDFEIFPPEISETIGVAGDVLSGAKTFEYVLIPRAPGRREIPPVTVAYFDGAAGEYRSAMSDAIPITVAGTVVEGPAALARGGVEQFRQDIRFIRLGSLDLRPSGGSVLAGAGFWLFALLPLMGIVGAVGLRRHWDLLEGDMA